LTSNIAFGNGDARARDLNRAQAKVVSIMVKVLKLKDVNRTTERGQRLQSSDGSLQANTDPL
jgi:hypothetical protein